MFFKRVLSSYISTSNTWDYLIVCLWILTVLLFISVILEKVSVIFILWICLVFNDLEHFPMFFIYISSVNCLIQVFLFSYSNYSIFLVKNKLKKRVDEQFLYFGESDCNQTSLVLRASEEKHPVSWVRKESEQVVLGWRDRDKQEWSSAPGAG